MNEGMSVIESAGLLNTTFVCLGNILGVVQKTLCLSEMFFFFRNFDCCYIEQLRASPLVVHYLLEDLHGKTEFVCRCPTPGCHQ